MWYRSVPTLTWSGLPAAIKVLLDLGGSGSSSTYVACTGTRTSANWRWSLDGEVGGGGEGVASRWMCNRELLS